MYRIKFGPAGNDESFYEQGYKTTLQMPGWLEKMELNAYEYQCGRGVNVSENTAKALGEKAKEHNISLSLHSPYFISLSSIEEEKRLNSINYILQSARAANDMGATRIVVHSGSCAKISREQALELAKDTLKRALEALDEQGYSHITLCPETMGKINQLGTLEEVLELCSIDERLIPAIDFGHLNARTMGTLKTANDFEKILEITENKIGYDRMKIFHSHFSKIEYTDGGEKKHLTFEDTKFGPDFEPLAEIICKKNLTPTIICESAGTMAIDAKKMLDIYMKRRNSYEL
ncbi:MAG: endonuclease IV [Ruminococcaceae bacterium]|nr:endonuclease IV [Oscillospiraceae bacterium]